MSICLMSVCQYGSTICQYVYMAICLYSNMSTCQYVYMSNVYMSVGQFGSTIFQYVDYMSICQ